MEDTQDNPKYREDAWDRGDDDNPWLEEAKAAYEIDEEEDEDILAIKDRVKGIRFELAERGELSQEIGGITLKAKDLGEDDVDLLKHPNLALLSIAGKVDKITFGDTFVTFANLQDKKSEPVTKPYERLTDEEIDKIYGALDAAAEQLFPL